MIFFHITNFSNFLKLARLRRANLKPNFILKLARLRRANFKMDENLAYLEKNENPKKYSKQTSK